jgi:uncharacterized membrane protein
MQVEPAIQDDDGQGTNGHHSAREAAQIRARSLGVLSLALGVSELTLPGQVARLIGVSDSARTRNVLRVLGAREVASGLGLLSKPDSAAPVWSRVAGDALDLALLFAAFGTKRTSRARLAATTAAVAGITALDVLGASRLSRKASMQQLTLPIHVVRAITVNRSPEVVYQFWRKLENLPRFMSHLESVQEQQDGSSLWRAKGPAGITIEWQAEITLDKANEALAWRSLEGTAVPNRGVVRFKPGPAGQGTELRVELKYDPPGGKLGAALAKLFGEEPSQQIAGDLRRLKQVLETGSIAHSDASIHEGMHAARPAAPDEPTSLPASQDQPRLRSAAEAGDRSTLPSLDASESRREDRNARPTPSHDELTSIFATDLRDESSIAPVVYDDDDLKEDELDIDVVNEEDRR